MYMSILGTNPLGRKGVIASMQRAGVGSEKNEEKRKEKNRRQIHNQKKTSRHVEEGKEMKAGKRERERERENPSLFLKGLLF